MSYSIDLANAAMRHYEAGEHLHSKSQRQDVAGYLYGIAAECAVKELMRRSGMRPKEPELRREDPFYAHFPELKTMLRNRIHGRNSQIIQRFIEASFMHEWDTDMRYAPAKDIEARKIDRWREQAKQVIGAMQGN